MIFDFLEMKEQNMHLEKELQLLKEEHLKNKMTKEQVEKLQMKMKEEIMKANKNNKSRMVKYTVAAALIAGFMVLPNTSATIAQTMGKIPVIGHLVEAVTFRDYNYNSERNMADVKVPEIKVGDHLEDQTVQKNLEHTAEEINTEIQSITNKLVKEFKENIAEEGGYQDIMVDSEVLTATDDYFTLKLNCYQAAGSGYEFNYYYTIDLNTGKRLKLKDIFQDGADYISPISENIKKQMKEQMAADENVVYWLDSDMEEWNFEQIKEDTSFYLNEKGQLVISFNEGDVAPMYMGVVEFVIPEEILEHMVK